MSHLQDKMVGSDERRVVLVLKMMPLGFCLYLNTRLISDAVTFKTNVCFIV